MYFNKILSALLLNKWALILTLLSVFWTHHSVAFEINTLQCTANTSQSPVPQLPLHHHPLNPIYNAGDQLLHAIRTHDTIPYSIIQEILDKYVYSRSQPDSSSTVQVEQLPFVQQTQQGESATPHIELVDQPPASTLPPKYSQITNSQILNYAWSITKTQVGFAIALFLGVAFVVLIPIVGVLFCICRCCDRCGGKRYQPPEPSQCRCGFLVIATIVCVMALIAGIVVFSFSNELSWKSLEQTASDIDSEITAIERFGNTTINQVTCVAERYFDVVMTEVLQRLRTLPVTTVQTFRNLTGLDQIEQTQKRIEQLQQQDLKACITADQVAMNSIINFTNVATAFIDGLSSSAFTSIPTNSSQIVRAELNKYVDFTLLNHLKTTDQNLKAALSNQTLNLTRQITQTINRLNDAMLRAESDLGPLQQQISSINASSRRSIAEMNAKADSFVADLSKQASSIVHKTLTPNTFRDYSWVPGVLSVLLVPTLLILLTLVLGLVCGLCGYHRHNCDIPYKRTTSSNFGGNCMIASVVLCFVFSWLMMVVTVVTFGAGYAIENFFCDPIFQSHSKPMYDFIDVQINRSGGFQPINDFIDKYKYSYQFSSFLAVNSCQHNDALFEAFAVGQILNVDKLVENLTNVSINLNDFWTYNPGDLYIMPNELQQFLRGFIIPAMQNLTELMDIYETKLQSVPTKTEHILANLTGEPSLSAVDQATADQLAADLRHWLTLQRQVALAKSQTTTDNLDAITQDTKSILAISTNATAQRAIYDSLRSYTNHQIQEILEFIKAFGKQVAHDVLKSIGRCRPLYDIWQNVGNKMMCQNVANAIHGLWISLGWCVVWYIPTLIFAVLLAKYLHRMDEYYYLDSRLGRSGGGHGGHTFATADQPILDAYSMPTLQMPPRIHPYNYQRGSKYAYG